jgi:hypothetical protein
MTGISKVMNVLIKDGTYPSASAKHPILCHVDGVCSLGYDDDASVVTASLVTWAGGYGIRWRRVDKAPLSGRRSLGC